MNRRLNNTLIALSASGLLLVAGLLAGTPVDPTGPSATPSLELADAGSPEATDTAPRVKSARRGLAMPYFSFAHGMRRIGG